MALQSKGAEVQLAFEQETTFAADPASWGSGNLKLFPFTSEDLRLSRETIRSESITAVRDQRTPRRGNYNVNGTINFEVDAMWMGTILKNAIGSASSTNGGAGANWTHTITVGALPAGLVIDKRFVNVGSATGTQYFHYNGCKINQLSMSFNPSGFVTGSIAIVGSKETQTTTAYDSTVDTSQGINPFDGFEATIYEGGSGTTTLGYANRVEFTLDNSLDDDNFVIGGGGYRRSLPEGKAIITGRMTVLFEDISLYTKAVNFDTSLLKLVLTRGTGNGSANNEYLEILIPELKYDTSSPVVPNDSGLEVELPFSAFASSGSSTSSLRCIVKNTQTSI